MRLNAHSNVLNIQGDKKSLHSTNGDGAASGLAANVSRKPSLRQQEKAPEGRSPHIAQDDGPAAAADSDEEEEPVGQASAGPAPTESRFQEEL